MTAPVWMASPPEVHSALLSAGPGPEALVAAAAAWDSLSAEYAEAAEKLGSLLSAVAAHAWDGIAADSYVTAHAPYLAWLLHASTDSAARAAQHQGAATAHTAALAAMPTLAELAANHATHAALLVTNFFGINTIPIALTEADYVRMWVQAATTMTVYQATATAAVASLPPALPSPPILKSSEALLAAPLDPGRAFFTVFQSMLLDLGVNPLIRNPLVSNVVTTFIADVLENFGIDWDPATGMLNGLGYESYADATQPMWYVARGLELIGDSMQMTQNPAQAVQYFLALSLFDWPTHIAQLGNALSQAPLLVASLGGAMMLPAGAGGLAGLAGLAGVAAPGAAPAAAAVAAAPHSWPISAINAPPTTFASTGASAPASGPAPTAAPATVGSAPATAAAAGPTFTPPYVVGPPGIGFGSGMTSKAGADAKKKAPEPDSAAAAAPSRAAVRRQARARLGNRNPQRHYADEFMDMDFEVEPDVDRSPEDETGTTVSERGASRLGLAGTGRAGDLGADAAGMTTLTTLPGNEFGGGPTLPMVPRSWR